MNEVQQFYEAIRKKWPKPTKPWEELHPQEFTAEYDRYLLLLRKIQEDINAQRTAIQDKLYLSDDAAEVLALIDAL